MTPYSTLYELLEVERFGIESLNEMFDRETVIHLNKQEKERERLKAELVALPTAASDWHRCSLAEQIRDLNCLTFSDGVTVPDIWQVSSVPIKFSHYIIEADIDEPDAPLRVELHGHDERQLANSILQANEAIELTHHLVPSWKPLYLSPEYLPWLHGFTTLIPGPDLRFQVYSYQFEPLLDPRQPPVIATIATAFDETACMHLSARVAKRLRGWLTASPQSEKSRKEEWWDLVVTDNLSKGYTELAWFKRSYSLFEHPAMYFRAQIPSLDATALWNQIMTLRGEGIVVTARGHIELGQEAQELLLRQLDFVIKLSLLRDEIASSSEILPLAEA